MKILVYFIMVIIAIILHEFGHYVASKMNKLSVESFCIGVGPKLFGFKKFGTRFEMRLLPIAGCITNDINEVDRISFLKEWIIDLSGVFMNFMAAMISLSIFNHKNIFVIMELFFAKVIRPLWSYMLNINNYVQPSESNISFINQNISSNEFLLLFAAINIALFTFNLLPIPLLDGGQLIMCIIRRICNKSNRTKEIYSKITNIVYLICWILLILPVLFRFLPVYKVCYIIMAFLFGCLITVIKQTKIYNDIKNKKWTEFIKKIK